MLFGALRGYSNQWRYHRRPYTPAVFWKKRKTHGRMSRWGLPQQKSLFRTSDHFQNIFAITALQVHIFILIHVNMSVFHRRKWLVPWQQWESTMSKLKSRGLKTRPIRCWWRGERKLIIWLLKMRRLLAKDTFALSHMHTHILHSYISWNVWFKEAITELKRVFFLSLNICN